MLTTEKKEQLYSCLREYTKQDICIAFSGGADSSLLVKLACEAARENETKVYAVTFNTRLHPLCDLENAKKVAKELGACHEILLVNELELEEIRNNPPERCYFCKRHLFERLIAFAEKKEITCILDGTNEDDLHVYRPGLRALKELGIKSPLALCHLTKREVKKLAADLGISAADRPSTPCMATRLPYGARLDAELLHQIEEGEAYLRTIISGNLRLRLHGEVARIETDAVRLQELLMQREEIAHELKKLGFRYITLDLEGFRSGSMDSALTAFSDHTADGRKEPEIGEER